MVRPEGEIVEARIGLVAAKNHADLTLGRRRRSLGELQHSTEAAIFLACLGVGSSVAGLGEYEFLEIRAGTEEAVLRPLERCRTIRLGDLVGIIWLCPVLAGVVDQHP